MEVTSKVFAVGNSHAVRLPRLIMEALTLKAGDPISIEVINNEELVIRKSAPHGAYPSIRELFDGYTGDYTPVEMDSASLRGRELI